MENFIYYARKIISIFGWVVFGCCLAVSIEYGANTTTICGLIISALTGISSDIGNEKPIEEDEEECGKAD